MAYDTKALLSSLANNVAKSKKEEVISCRNS